MFRPPLVSTTDGEVAVGAGLGETPVGQVSVKENVAVPGTASTNGVGEAAVVPALTWTFVCLSGELELTAWPVAGIDIGAGWRA